MSTDLFCWLHENILHNVKVKSSLLFFCPFSSSYDCKAEGTRASPWHMHRVYCSWFTTSNFKMVPQRGGVAHLRLLWHPRWQALLFFLLLPLIWRFYLKEEWMKISIYGNELQSQTWVLHGLKTPTCSLLVCVVTYTGWYPYSLPNVVPLPKCRDTTL